jgi:asparagine synthase (glutamine-hydrolysing)
MCGIAAIVDPSSPTAASLRESLRRMTTALAHRGPDGEGQWLSDDCRIALGHRRLAIVDLSPRAAQPMHRSGLSVVFNGEIYNHQEKRRELEKAGVVFTSDSDTEVLLALYARYGEDCVSHCNGMFAFALWDNARRRLLLARDRIGVKPLYYRTVRGAVFIASEIKALVGGGDARPSIDPIALSGFLLNGCIEGRRTIYDGIRELPPAHVASVTEKGELTFRKYWHPRLEPSGDTTPPDHALAERFERAVELRLRADVETAVFLSGGIDSGLVVAAASRYRRRLKTFTIAVSGHPAMDERSAARLVAERFETDHEELVVQANPHELVQQVANHYDEPTSDGSALITYALSRALQGRIKVILNGDGGDELFGGYRRHQLAYVRARLSGIVSPSLQAKFASALLNVLPSNPQFRSRREYFVSGLKVIAGEEEILEAVSHSLHPLLRDAETHDLDTEWQAVAKRNPIRSMLFEDLFRSLPDDLLVKMDMATMAHGLEARSPFLDVDLVEWALQIPGHALLSWRRTKPLLRRYARRLLPAAIAGAPKRGFEVPLHVWLQGPLKEMRNDLILGPSNSSVAVIPLNERERLLRNEYGWSSRVWTSVVWRLMMLAAWEDARSVSRAA